MEAYISKLKAGSEINPKDTALERRQQKREERAKAKEERRKEREERKRIQLEEQNAAKKGKGRGRGRKPQSKKVTRQKKKKGNKIFEGSYLENKSITILHYLRINARNIVGPTTFLFGPTDYRVWSYELTPCLSVSYYVCLSVCLLLCQSFCHSFHLSFFCPRGVALPFLQKGSKDFPNFA